MASHNELGKQGEDLAVRHLLDNGYAILARNWWYGKYEIDIVARKGGIIAFVEVKTRSGDLFGTPEEGVSRLKERHVAEAADAYIRQHGIDLEARFDIVSITFFRGRHELRLIEDAFYPYM